jgi:hypothetical protein
MDGSHFYVGEKWGTGFFSIAKGLAILYSLAQQEKFRPFLGSFT